LTRFSIGKSRVRLLFRPAKLTGVAGFYLIAAAPRIDAGNAGSGTQGPHPARRAR